MKRLKSSYLLRIGLTVIVFFSLILAMVAWWQSNILWQQTRNLYEHPLTVRRAIGEFQSSILNIHMGMKDIFLVRDSASKEQVFQKMEQHKVNALKMAELMRERFLGPGEWIDSLEAEVVKWNVIRAETIRLLNIGKREEAVSRTYITGPGGRQAAQINEKLRKISDFAIAKGDEFYSKADQLHSTLIFRLIILTAIILFLSVVIALYLVRFIRQPLEDLMLATSQFSQGNYQVRSNYQKNNEFGRLAGSFNQLANSIQADISRREELATITGKMITTNQLSHFVTVVLEELIRRSHAVTGAIFIREEDEKSFVCLASHGLVHEKMQSQPWNEEVGEIGVAVKSGKIEKVTQIPHDTVLLYSTIHGTIVPREIITIPIHSGKHVIGVISLAGTRSFSESAITLFNQLLPLLTARINALLSAHKIKTISERLNEQNRELLSQQEELTRQSQEMKVQNTELEMQKQQLFEAGKLKTTFLSNMSHELRTPLNSVIALSGVLNRRLSGKIGKDEFEYLEVIERNGRLLLNLINEILDLSRIESGREESDLSEFNLNSVIREVCEMIAPQAQQKNILLNMPEPADAPMVVSDLRKGRQILQNLIGNAIKFTSEGSVEVAIESKEQFLHIHVIDTGIGIADSQISHIFDEFRQADETTARKFGGSGLGLAIARKYARFLGGEIMVHSTPGKGSVFTWILPFTKEGAPLPSDQEIAEGAQKVQQLSKHTVTRSGQPITVLLVDDSEPAIIQLTDILTSEQFRVVSARGGAEALQLLEAEIPDAIVLDLMMPEVDGFQVLTTIRNNHRTSGIPVLVLTAKHITREEMSTLKQNNIHQLIQKGDVNRTELIRAIRKMTQSDPVEAPSVPPGVPNDGKAIILAVEDNADNMLTLRALLSERFHLVEAVTGIEGVEYARKFQPMLILMDIALPEMNGIEALHQIRSDPATSTIPVVAVTASAMSGDRDAIVAEGFDGYVSKPIDVQELEDMLSRFIENIRPNR